MRLEVFVARKVGSLVGLGKNYNKMVPSVKGSKIPVYCCYAVGFTMLIAR